MKEIKEHLDNALRSETPDVFEAIVSRIENEEIIMTVNTKNTKIIHFASKAKYFAAAACFMLMLGGIGAYGYSYNYGADTTIGIDVNPSIQLEISKSNKVVDVEALNEDAEIIIDDMELEKLDVEIAVNAITGSMLKNGYLTDGKILITVQNKNQARKDSVTSLVVSQVESLLNNENVAPHVVSQAVDDLDAEVQRFAQEHNISYGKAKFIFAITQVKQNIKKEDLVTLSIDVLDDMYDDLDDINDDRDDLDDIDDDRDDIDDLYDDDHDDLDDLYDDDDRDDLDDLYDDDRDDLDDLYDDDRDDLDDLYDDDRDDLDDLYDDDCDDLDDINDDRDDLDDLDDDDQDDDLDDIDDDDDD